MWYLIVFPCCHGEACHVVNWLISLSLGVWFRLSSPYWTAKCTMTSWNGIFSAQLVLCGGIHRSPVNSSHKGQWHKPLVFSLICACTNSWANDRDAGDLRYHRAHHDVTVMWFIVHQQFSTSLTDEAWMRNRFIGDGITLPHHNDVIMSAMASQITNALIICSNVCSS